MAVALGHGAFLGFGEESTYGTEVVRSNWLRVNAASLKRDRVKQVLPDLGSYGQASSNPREFFVERDDVLGAFSFNMSYDDSTLLILKHLLGAVATGSGPPYTHTFTLASPQPTGLTIEQAPGNSPGFSHGQQFVGCRLAGGTITIVPGRPVVCDISVMGRTSAGLEVIGAPTLTAPSRIYQHQAGNITLGGTTIALKQMVIRFDRGLQRLPEIGSLFTSAPTEERISVDIELTAAWQANKFHTNFFADTIEDLAVTFTGPSSRAMAITAHNCLIMSTDEPSSGPGAIEQKIALKAFADSGGDQGLTIAITNSNSSAVAN